MLYQAMVYKTVEELNMDAQGRYALIKAQEPGASADRYWYIQEIRDQEDGALLVLWCRRMTVI